MYQPYNVFGTTGQPRCTKIGCTKNYGTTRCTKNYCTPVVPRIMVQLDAIVMITPRLYQELWYRGCTKNYCMPVVPRIMVHNMYQKLRLARLYQKLWYIVCTMYRIIIPVYFRAQISRSRLPTLPTLPGCVPPCRPAPRFL